MPQVNWNPELYLRFSRERLLPILDLLPHIDPPRCDRLLDIGCGPGNAVQPILQRWPKTSIVGLDSSPEMIEAARQNHGHCEWHLKDISEGLEEFGTFDVVFSNSVLHWLPNHDAAIRSFFARLNPGGVLAVQLPNDNDSPFFLTVRQLAASQRWVPYFTRGEIVHYGEVSLYYDILRSLTDDFRIWHSIYYHVVPSVQAIVEWYRATGLRPFLDQLQPEKQAEFEAELAEMLRELYPTRHGAVLFPFKRLFFTARNC